MNMTNIKTPGATVFFVAAHYKQWFLKYEYLRGARFSVGVTENISDRND
jgi:hypothetical protein